MQAQLIPRTVISPFSFLLSHLIPLRGLFILRTSAIQASLIALGLASVLLSHFIFTKFLLQCIEVLLIVNLLTFRSVDVFEACSVSLFNLTTNHLHRTVNHLILFSERF